LSSVVRIRLPFPGVRPETASRFIFVAWSASLGFTAIVIFHLTPITNASYGAASRFSSLWPFQLPGSNDRANPTRCSRWRTKLLIPTVKTWIREALVILSIRRVQTRGRNINRTCLAVSNRHTNFLGRFHCWNITKQQSGFTDFEVRARLSGTRAASLQRW
jgi:hypothetical protein